MDQEAVRVPVGDWAQARLRNLSETDRARENSRVGSGFGKNVSNWIGRETVYPTNVLHLATECGNKRHSAAFPEALADWFIRLFSPPGGVILDPFLGSGTTAAVAVRLGRVYLGVEKEPEYYQVALERVATQVQEAA